MVAGTAVAMVAANQDGTAVVKDPEDPDKSQADEIREFGGMTGAPISADMLGFGQYSGGGMTPMGTDTVPAMLTPGEFVMSRGAVNTFGSGFMEMINAAGGGTNKPKNGYFSAGGYVPGLLMLKTRVNILVVEAWQPECLIHFKYSVRINPIVDPVDHLILLLRR